MANVMTDVISLTLVYFFTVFIFMEAGLSTKL